MAWIVSIQRTISSDRHNLDSMHKDRNVDRKLKRWPGVGVGVEIGHVRISRSTFLSDAEQSTVVINGCMTLFPIPHKGV